MFVDKRPQKSPLVHFPSFGSRLTWVWPGHMDRSRLKEAKLLEGTDSTRRKVTFYGNTQAMNSLLPQKLFSLFLSRDSSPTLVNRRDGKSLKEDERACKREGREKK